MTGQKKLKDFFIDAKVPSKWRDRVPLVVSNKGIAWVVGYRIADWAKVLDGQGLEDSILRVSFELPN
jgi:tRNA(Ile)-lysidine synthase